MQSQLFGHPNEINIFVTIAEEKANLFLFLFG